MDKFKSKVFVNEESKSISISGLKDEKVVIDYSGDVDFTEFVSVLTECIDQDDQINFIIPEDIDDDKLSVILNTIEKIFNNFNEVQTEEISLSDIETKISESSKKDDIEDDLPF